MVVDTTAPEPTTIEQTAVLEVEDLHVGFGAADDDLRAVDGVSLSVAPGETVCIVGESGSGKSALSMSIMRLIDFEGGTIRSGAIRIGGQDLATASQKEARSARGEHLSMIFQEPMSALNPVHTVSRQIGEMLLLHGRATKRTVRDEVLKLLDDVGMPDSRLRAKQYPHQLSGGLRQRVLIAMAIACRPRLLIADEPTTALDVTTEAQILGLLRSLRDRYGMSVVLITHDMGVAAQMADRILVMYAGKIVEQGTAEELFARPRHPYTQGLLASIPSRQGVPGSRLHAIPGTMPSIGNRPSGCSFHPRCAFATDRCATEIPVPRPLEGSTVACHRADEAPVLAAATALHQHPDEHDGDTA
ncbi:ABC transporter ATP-binding protein [Nocardioides bruguierae]|uniref:ABC transporter ATP-binding protein n=1 Tax=Nocardioides bruguierae TaxID=2945102 RepID=UPI00201FDE22|nr:ABC transporter ATP-binding protein [Nocardioides bruguierae]MCL8025323.1 ABC transporter ATP-binding protein [Nocardioides bruguierae]